MEYQHTWIDHPMTVSIYFDDRMIHLDQGHSKAVIDKKISLPSGSHILKIKIANKDNRNTIVNEKGEIVEDSMITINKLKIDEINLNAIMEADCVYHTEPNGILERTVQLGLNGEWQLPMKTPVYEWLLEKLY